MEETWEVQGIDIKAYKLVQGNHIDFFGKNCVSKNIIKILEFLLQMFYILVPNDDSCQNSFNFMSQGVCLV